MRIRIVGTGAYSHVNVEYDVLMSTPVMNVKARIISQNIKCTTGCSIQETAIYTTKLWR